jgi:hypothetical protein
MKWAEHVAEFGETRNTYRILVVKAEGKRPLEKSRRRWVENIKIHLREMGVVNKTSEAFSRNVTLLHT